MNLRVQLIVLVSLGASLLTGCSVSRVSGVVTSEERRIWVVRSSKDNDEVYRCADGAEPGKPPKPVCVRAPLVDTPQ